MPRRPKTPVSATIKGDLTRLQNMSPAPDAYVPPAAHLDPVQLSEIERLAGQGFSLGQIGLKLEIEDETWEETIQLNPNVRKAFQKGILKIQDAASATVVAKTKEDANIALKWLERFGGKQYAPPRDQPQVIVAPVLSLPDVDRIQGAFERQRRLLNGQEIDGEARETEEKKIESD